MPYFVFRIGPEKDLTLLQVYAKFQEAKAFCREQRRAQPPGDTTQIRMVFAATEKEGRRLLTEKRQPSSPIEEWEA
jgi:hypothetical protein